MRDTLTRTAQSQVTDKPTRPSLVTTVLCTAATAKCLHVFWLMIHTPGAGLSRAEIGHIFLATALGLPALCLLARDMMSCPRARHTVETFRLGVAIGKLRRR